MRERRLQHENMGIAKRILEMKSAGFNGEQMSRDF
jgi:hypothetical protein